WWLSLIVEQQLGEPINRIKLLLTVIPRSAGLVACDTKTLTAERGICFLFNSWKTKEQQIPRAIQPVRGITVFLETARFDCWPNLSCAVMIARSDDRYWVLSHCL